MDLKSILITHVTKKLRISSMCVLKRLVFYFDNIDTAYFSNKLNNFLLNINMFNALKMELMDFTWTSSNICLFFFLFHSLYSP